MRKLLLVQPKFLNSELDRNIKTIYPLGLGYLAAHVPPGWEVEIKDEQIESLQFDVDADVVGITTTTLTANRAYAVAAEFQKRKKPVILGGVHASICPDEAARFADAVCVGDGEILLPQMLEDAIQGRLQKVYRAEFGPLTGLKAPRRDLFKSGYTFIPVSTSRGCPFSCSFCCINRFYGGSYRTRDPEDVIEELKTLPRKNGIIFFTDGNMFGHSQKDQQRFKELCRRIREERDKGTVSFKTFMGYASLNALADEEALDLASQAGCGALLVGFESINPASLKEMNKTLNLRLGVDAYSRLIGNAQRKKIAIVGEMIIGNDSDDARVLAETDAFLAQINFDLLRLQILQPLPGTKLYERLEGEGRLLLKDFPGDWDKLAADFIMGVHFQPKQLTPTQIKTWVKQAGLSFYSPWSMCKRAFRSYRASGDPMLGLTILAMNLKSRKSYKNARI